jgi:hypothetical protein
VEKLIYENEKPYIIKHETVEPKKWQTGLVTARHTICMQTLLKKRQGVEIYMYQLAIQGIEIIRKLEARRILKIDFK